MSGLCMFIPLTKVDAEKRLVYGIATAEVKDRSGEICDYASSKPNFEKWSAEVHAASGGLSKGNLRAMHGKTAAGKIEEIHFNDASKQVEICAKVVDDAEWQKVIEGVYTGFSQGGSYGKRWTDADGVKRYEAKPSEISLVDLPCLASATFELVKADGAERHHFAAAVTVPDPDNAAVAAKAAELAKAAGKDDFGAFLEPAREELLKAVLPAPAVEDMPPKSGSVAEGDSQQVEKAAGPVPAADDLAQGWLCKADGSFHATKAEARRHGAKLDADAAARAEAGPALDALAGLGKTLGRQPEPTIEDDWLELAKRGARNSRADMSKIQAMHDHACDLGASCRSDADANKVAALEDLAKAADALAKVEAMTKSVEALRAENAELRKTVEAQPVPAHLQGRAISKREDTGGSDAPVLAGDDLAKALAALPPDEAALILTKAALSQPQRMVKSPG